MLTERRDSSNMTICYIEFYFSNFFSHHKKKKPEKERKQEETKHVIQNQLQIKETIENQRL